MYQAAKVQFPSLGWYPGFASLAQEPANEWRGKIQPLSAASPLSVVPDPATNPDLYRPLGARGMGDVTDDFFTLLGDSVNIGSYDVPVWLIVAGLAGVFVLGHKSPTLSRRGR